MFRMKRSLSLLAAALLSACASDVYVRGGVTDGDTFFVAPVAYATDDPSVASWLRYSLIRSTCQLELGGPNPARANSYACELKGREHLVDAWLEHRASGGDHEDAYLDDLATVREAGFLDEYTAHYFAKDERRRSQTFDWKGFERWRGRHLKRHRPQTRLVGYWGYRQGSEAPP